MKKFKCDVCGKEHPFYGSMELLEPDAIFMMSEEEKQRRVEKFESAYDSFLLVDKSYILTKGDLFVKIKEYDEYMHWNIWVKLLPKDFFRVIENLDYVEPIIRGEIMSQLPQYENSLGEKVDLELFLSNTREVPVVRPISMETELGADYYSGISIEKAKSWMKAMYH